MLRAWVLVVFYAQTCFSLYLAKGSPCSSKCNITGGTFWPDLVCSDDDFANTPKGQTLESCLGCTVDSTFINSSYTDGNSDQFWLLYHMKYVQQYCLIDNTTPHIAAVNACTPACSPLSDVLTSLWINKHPFVGQYDYCSSYSSEYPNNAADCSKCLQAQKGSVIIGNFVDTMLNACKSKPLVSNGELIQPKRDLFRAAVIPLSSSMRASSTVSSGATTSSIKSTSTTRSNGGSSANVPVSSATGVVVTETEYAGASQSALSQTGLSTGAAAGIGAAVAIVALGIVAGIAFLIVKRRQRVSAQENQPLAVELKRRDQSPPYSSVKYGYSVHEQPQEPVYEKYTDNHIYEAPSGSQNRLIELPGSNP